MLIYWNRKHHYLTKLKNGLDWYYWEKYLLKNISQMMTVYTNESRTRIYICIYAVFNISSVYLCDWYTLELEKYLRLGAKKGIYTMGMGKCIFDCIYIDGIVYSFNLSYSNIAIRKTNNIRTLVIILSKVLTCFSCEMRYVD